MAKKSVTKRSNRKKVSGKSKAISKTLSHKELLLCSTNYSPKIRCCLKCAKDFKSPQKDIRLCSPCRYENENEFYLEPHITHSTLVRP